jgi:hypothetical protein
LSASLSACSPSSRSPAPFPAPPSRCQLDLGGGDLLVDRVVIDAQDHFILLDARAMRHNRHDFQVALIRIGMKAKLQRINRLKIRVRVDVGTNRSLFDDDAIFVLRR